MLKEHPSKTTISLHEREIESETLEHHPLRWRSWLELYASHEMCQVQILAALLGDLIAGVSVVASLRQPQVLPAGCQLSGFLGSSKKKNFI